MSCHVNCITPIKLDFNIERGLRFLSKCNICNKYVISRDGDSVAQLLSSPVMFSTDMAARPERRVTSTDLGDTRDLVLVSLILVMWVIVILLFLHRWGEHKDKRLVETYFRE